MRIGPGSSRRNLSEQRFLPGAVALFQAAGGCCLCTRGLSVSAGFRGGGWFCKLRCVLLLKQARSERSIQKTYGLWFCKFRIRPEPLAYAVPGDLTGLSSGRRAPLTGLKLPLGGPTANVAVRQSQQPGKRLTFLCPKVRSILVWARGVGFKCQSLFATFRMGINGCSVLCGCLSPLSSL